MDDIGGLEGILRRMTPEYLRDMVFRLAARQVTDRRSSVSVPDVLDAMAEGTDLGAGAARWEAHLRLVQAQETVARIDGLCTLRGFLMKRISSSGRITGPAIQVRSSRLEGENMPGVDEW
jgi:hypothetical protein